MGFIQIIEYRTSKADEMEALGQEWEAQASDERTTQRVLVCQDRDDPERFFNVVFFESYEEAMKNSELPATQELSGKMAGLVDGAPTFYNLDVIADR
jgi:hypothetical protein